MDTSSLMQRAARIAVDHFESTGKFKNAGKVHAYVARTKNDDQKLFWNRGYGLRELQAASKELRDDLGFGRHRHALYLLKKHPLLKKVPGMLGWVFLGRWNTKKTEDGVRDAVFREILQATSDQKSKNDALYYAIDNHVPVGILKDLLDAGADPNAKGSFQYGGSSVLTATIQSYGFRHGTVDPLEHLEAMKLLLKRGADVRFKTSWGEDALHLYLRRKIYWNTPEGVKLLLKYGARPSVRLVVDDRTNRANGWHSHLGLAIRTGSADIVKLVLDAGAWLVHSPRGICQVVSQSVSQRRIDDGECALEFAVKLGHVEIVKLLLQRTGALYIPAALRMGKGAVSNAIRDHLQKTAARKRNNDADTRNKKRQRNL